MLRFWFLETLGPRSRWIPEPWFQPTHCYRDAATAQQHFTWLLEREVKDRPARRRALRRKWRTMFGGQPVPMPETQSVCRLVRAKGPSVLLGRFANQGTYRRREGVLGGRAHWSNRRRTFYLLRHRKEVGGELVQPRTWPHELETFLGFRTLRAAVAYARTCDATFTVYRVDATVEELERTTVG